MSTDIEMPDFLKLWLELMKDVNTARRLMDNDRTCQFHRRNFIRSLFALTDGLTYQLKQLALENAEADRDLYQPEELFLIREQNYELDKNGEPVRKGGGFPRMIPNFRFAVSMFMKRYDSTFRMQMPEGDPGAQAFRQCNEIRNDITHPKNPSKVNITDGQVKDASTAYSWLLNQVASRLTQVAAYQRINRADDVPSTTMAAAVVVIRELAGPADDIRALVGKFAALVHDDVMLADVG